MGFVGWIMPIMIILCLAWGALWGFKRKLYHTLLRFGTLVVAALASLLLAKLLGGLLGDYALSALTSLLGEGAAASLSDPNYAALAQALGQMLAAPILFFLCYLVLKPLSWLLFILIVSLFRIPKGPKLFGRLSGAVAGLLCGFLGLVVFVVPVSGYLTVVDNAAAQIWEADEMPAELAEITDIKNTPVAKQAYDWVGAAIFDSLTTAQMGEAEVSLQGEINAVLALVEDTAHVCETAFAVSSLISTPASVNEEGSCSSLINARSSAIPAAAVSSSVFPAGSTPMTLTANLLNLFRSSL